MRSSIRRASSRPRVERPARSWCSTPVRTCRTRARTRSTAGSPARCSRCGTAAATCSSRGRPIAICSIAPAATLDLIGASTGHGLLQLGSSVIDASVPAVLDLFEWIGHERVLPTLGVRELRLIGCRTAIEPAAHDTMRRLAELVGVPITGTTTLIYRDNFRRTGLDGDLDATMIDARSLPPRKVPALWPELVPRTRELAFDAVGLTCESALPSVAWPRFVVPKGLDVLGQVRTGEGRALPGLLAL